MQLPSMSRGVSNADIEMSFFACVSVVSVESRDTHLRSLVVEAERRAAELAAQAQRDGLSLEACHKDKQLKAWEWRCKLYKRMRTGFQHARERHLCFNINKQFALLQFKVPSSAISRQMCLMSLRRCPRSPVHGAFECQQQHDANGHFPGAAVSKLNGGDEVPW